MSNTTVDGHGLVKDLPTNLHELSRSVLLLLELRKHAVIQGHVAAGTLRVRLLNIFLQIPASSVWHFGKVLTRQHIVGGATFEIRRLTWIEWSYRHAHRSVQYLELLICVCSEISLFRRFCEIHKSQEMNIKRRALFSFQCLVR